MLWNAKKELVANATTLAPNSLITFKLPGTPTDTLLQGRVASVNMTPNYDYGGTPVSIDLVITLDMPTTEEVVYQNIDPSNDDNDDAQEGGGQ